jgi:hypothetical protein
MLRKLAVIGAILQDVKLSALMTGCHVSVTRDNWQLMKEAEGHDNKLVVTCETIVKQCIFYRASCPDL